MRDWEKQVFRKLSGSKPDAHLPTLAQLRAREEAILSSAFPIRLIGYTEDSALYLTEEQRESHIHILGSPGQGKSKLLEMLIRQDLKAGYGACLLDPSDNGDTMYKMLRWCIKNGFEKVCIIDPHDRKQWIPTIYPHHNLMETVRILFDTRSFSDTPRIQKYLPAVLYALAKADKTLAELVNFTDQRNPVYSTRRTNILEEMHPLDRRRIDLEEVFRNRQVFTNEFESTIRRLEPFLERTMQLMFGLRTGIPFNKMITEGWLILCNLDSSGVSPDFGNEHQRLIGTMVINELFYAISRLRARGWRGVYYLYIDEVGDYATRNISTLLDKKRKSGLRLTVAHQRFAQLEDKFVSDAIMTGARIKVLFQTANADDRYKMVRMMYGGDLSDRMVTYVLGALAKQQAVFKVEKQPAVTVRLKNVPDIQVSPDEVEAFKQKIYNRDEWYHSPESILTEINARFKKEETTRTLTRRKQASPEKVPPEPVANNERTPGAARGRSLSSKAKGNRGSAPGAIPNNSPSSGSILLSRKGRSTRKVSPDTPPTGGDV